MLSLGRYVRQHDSAARRGLAKDLGADLVCRQATHNFLLEIESVLIRSNDNTAMTSVAELFRETRTGARQVPHPSRRIGPTSISSARTFIIGQQNTVWRGIPNAAARMPSSQSLTHPTNARRPLLAQRDTESRNLIGDAWQENLGPPYE